VITVDTNVLVRILIDDPSAPDQMRIARELARNSGTLFVPQIVQVETVWVLQSAYGFDKATILTILAALLENPTVLLEQRERFIAALRDFQSETADFSDYLILAASREIGTMVHTFDRRFAKQTGVLLAQTSQ
jgi:predicted nucleic-acid-binding protein